MTKKDWSEFQVQIQPLARKLNEAMNRREYEDAHVLALQLMGVAHAIGTYAAEKKEPRSYYG